MGLACKGRAIHSHGKIHVVRKQGPSNPNDATLVASQMWQESRLRALPSQRRQTRLPDPGVNTSAKATAWEQGEVGVMVVMVVVVMVVMVVMVVL